MAADRKATSSTPPKTEDIDVEWSGYLDEEPTIPGVIPESLHPSTSSSTSPLPPTSPDSVPPDSERPTRVPTEPIEEIARRLMAQLPTDEGNGVLSSRRMQAISDIPRSGRGSMPTVTDEAAGSYDRAYAATARPDPDRVRTDPGGPELSLDLPDDDGSALDLIGSQRARAPSPVAPQPEPDSLAGAVEEGTALEMRDRYAVGDFTGALVMAEAVLETEPGNAEAQRYATTCREILVQMYTARLGSTSLVPKVTLTGDQIRWLTLDHRAGFLLSCIDGRSTIEEILDVCGMQPLDALRILCELVQQNVISLGAGR